MIGNKAFYMVLLLAVIMPFVAEAAGTSTSTLPSGMENPLPLRYPELLSAPAPSWLDEGLRATYYVIASTPESERTENVEYGTGSAGYGLSQVDVVALEDGNAATFTLPYAPDTQGAMRQMQGFGSVVPEGCGDFWCSPEVLGKVPEQASDEFTVQRLPVNIGGKDYQAIRFDIKSGTFEMALIYDLKTGIMLYHTVDYTSYSSQENEIIGTRGTHAIYEFRNLRKVKIPWNEGRVPQWLAKGENIGYQGQTSVQVQGASPMVTPMSVQVSVLDVMSRYAKVRLDTYNQDPVPPAYIITVSGISQLMGNWIPPEAIADLRPGIIDTDPDTNMQTSVVSNDGGTIIFEKTNQVDFRELFAYDSSGKLTEMYYEYNPDVMTATGFGSVKTVTLQLAE